MDSKRKKAQQTTYMASYSFVSSVNGKTQTKERHVAVQQKGSRVEAFVGAKENGKWVVKKTAHSMKALQDALAATEKDKKTRKITLQSQKIFKT